MLELPAADPAATAAWYADNLAMTATRSDPATGFVLLEGGGGRVAFKPGVPATAGIALHFEVDDLSPFPGAEKSSPEGYARKRLTDPNGYTVVLFRWLRGPAGGASP